MESIFTVIVVILAALAVSDLIVGVSNDATNFLNSAIGSKVAPRYVIMIVASAGILLGSFFSSGMMEVARRLPGGPHPHLDCHLLAAGDGGDPPLPVGDGCPRLAGSGRPGQGLRGAAHRPGVSRLAAGLQRGDPPPPPK